MGVMAYQITSLTIVYSTDYSGANQRKHQSSASLAFVRGIHRRLMKSPHKWQVTRKMFPFDDVIMSHMCRRVHDSLWNVKFLLSDWSIILLMIPLIIGLTVSVLLSIVAIPTVMWCTDVLALIRVLVPHGKIYQHLCWTTTEAAFPNLCWTCDYLSKFGLKLNHANKRLIKC